MEKQITKSESFVSLISLIAIPIFILLIKQIPVPEFQILFSILSAVAFITFSLISFRLNFRGDELNKMMKLEILAYTQLVSVSALVLMCIVQFAFRIFHDPLNALIVALILLSGIQSIFNAVMKKKYQ